MTGRRKASERAACRVLLTFTGFHDPFASAGVAGNEQEGPILSLVRARQFHHVLLLSTPNTEQNTIQTEQELSVRHPGLVVTVRQLPLTDPTDYFQILSGLRTTFSEVSKQFPAAECFIGTASGTPQMHACWVMLSASGEIPASLLQARNVKFVTSERPFVTEIDTTQPGFPVVRSRAWAQVEPEAPDNGQAAKMIRDLGIVGDDAAMTCALQRVVNVASYDVPVLVLGESGTGKEKVARLIHALSPRAKGPFVPVNCAAIPEHLAESILLGHEKGAFTGAMVKHIGEFERAHGGTLFLDEIGELPANVQPKLLRALQEQVIEPIGSKKARKVDCRFVAATNADLDNAMRAGKFRADLFYRVAVTQVSLPALRDRRSDIPKLAQHFLDELNSRYKKHRRFSPDALSLLQRYDWPGNVRELLSVVQGAAIHAISGLIEPGHLELRASTHSQVLDILPDPHEGFSLDSFVSSVRERLYARATEMAAGNASQAAKLLGVTPQAVQKFQKGKRR
jgi:DNA-binding NtrC family response regulator